MDKSRPINSQKIIEGPDMLNIRCILHPTDFSQPSANAFLVARALARDYGARLILLHVAQAPVHGIAGAAPVPPPTPIDWEGLEAQLRGIEVSHPQVRIEHRLAEGNPATTILDVARETACDVLVMGTHGRTGLGRVLMGSVAEKVVRSAACPVLTVKVPIPGTSSSGNSGAD
jgi:nucleotide-binding universal stress UspA family protein